MFARINVGKRNVITYIHTQFLGKYPHVLTLEKSNVITYIHIFGV